MSILVTGGAGFIGSHTCAELLNAGYQVVVVDNLTNSSRKSLERVREITGKPLAFYEEDLLNKPGLEKLFSKESIHGVIHFAGLKAVGESVEKPLEYYTNNLVGTLNLCEVMRRHGVYQMVFSSSATVYGKPHSVPIREDFPLSVTNPYGRTKLMIEDILRDLAAADPAWKIYLLRYFNPIGAHKSGRIGEDPKGKPNNLMPSITQAAIGKLDYLEIYGNDYDTKDGTGVRDYIHVVDLADGHVKAIQHLETFSGGIETYNLGTGEGYSVLEMVNTFTEVSKSPVPYRFLPRRPGDVPVCFADATKAKRELGWQANRNLRQMCEDAWRWQRNNPDGYL